MQRKGFTLIESIIVMSIVALLFTISLPRLSAFSKQLYLNNSAKLIASNIRQLQSQARLTHNTQTLDLAKSNLPKGINIIKASNIKFSASGSPPPGGSGSIILQNSLGQTKKIITSSAGRVRIE
jgi:prepilin-type N-terminal cleavage/methylation domain-containing protein